MFSEIGKLRAGKKIPLVEPGRNESILKMGQRTKAFEKTSLWVKN